MVKNNDLRFQNYILVPRLQLGNKNEINIGQASCLTIDYPKARCLGYFNYFRNKLSAKGHMKIKEQRKRERMKELQRMADHVCSLILISDYPEIDIEIEKTKVRERCEELYPDSMDLYEMIYESRFNRLWEQFRELSGQDET